MIILKMFFAAQPITRNAAVTVRSAGERLAPMRSLRASSQMPFENSLAKASRIRIVIYSACRVDIGYLLVECSP